MRRGTTPTITINTDISLVDAEVIYLTFEQNGNDIIEIDKERMTVNAEGIYAKLTQDETLLLAADNNVKLQIRARFPDQTAIASNIMSVKTEKILKEGVI